MLMSKVYSGLEYTLAIFMMVGHEPWTGILSQNYMKECWDTNHIICYRLQESQKIRSHMQFLKRALKHKSSNCQYKQKTFTIHSQFKPFQNQTNLKLPNATFQQSHFCTHPDGRSSFLVFIVFSISLVSWFGGWFLVTSTEFQIQVVCLQGQKNIIDYSNKAISS